MSQRRDFRKIGRGETEVSLMVRKYIGKEITSVGCYVTRHAICGAPLIPIEIKGCPGYV